VPNINALSLIACSGCVTEVHVHLDMCPAQLYFVLAHSNALLSFPMKHKLRLDFVDSDVYPYNIPVMILQSIPLQNRGKNYSQSTHACKQCRQHMLVLFARKSTSG
jgi:hypothetical protein